MGFKDIIKGASDLVFESQPETEKQASPVPKLQVPSGFARIDSNPSPAAFVQASVNSAADDGQVYDRLKANSDFTQDPTFAKLLSAAKPLETIIKEEGLRLKAAAASAGIDVTSLLATFPGLISGLDGQLKEFLVTADSRLERVKGEQTRVIEDCDKAITDLEAQISAKREQKNVAAKEIFDSQSKIDAAKAKFNSAVIRRKSELQAEQGKYTALLS